MTNHRFTAVALGALATAIAAPAAAQTTPDTRSALPAQSTDAPPADGTLSTIEEQEIVVTGSRIRGVEAVGSNIITLDQAAIAREPVSSTADLLRRVPQVVALGANRAGGSAQNGAANITRGAGINLRGLGNKATLLLYDGRRFPAQGTQGQYTDPSVLPTIALERVEVIADGASAIYGSDAIAGVVNFILRKNFDGQEFRVRAGVTDDGHYGEQQASGIIGRRWDSGWIMASGEYVHNSALTGAALPFYQGDLRSRGGRDYRTSFCNPGTISAGGRTYAIPAGGVSAANVATLTAGTANKCFYNGADTVIPEESRFSGVAGISQDIGDRIRLFANGFYSRRNGKTAGAFDTFTAVVPRTNPFFVSPVAGATFVNVDYGLYPELGANKGSYRSSSWNAVGGAEVKLFGDWRATATYAYGKSKEAVDRPNGVNGGALAAALADTNPATALNVFGGPNNPTTLARIHDNLFIVRGTNVLEAGNIQFDGSLFRLPGGNVKIAVGAEKRNESTDTDLILGSSTASFSIPGAASRSIESLYGEAYIPLFGSDNAIPGIYRLTLSVAGRYEDYSDVGSTTNPKFGATYEPIPGLSLRGSYGKSFRAPNFTETSTTGGGAGLYYETLPGPSGNLVGYGIAGGNPNLKPESATTWSVGGEARPRALSGLVVGATYFNIDYRDQILALRGTPGLLTNPLYASFVTLNPTPAQVSALLNSGLQVIVPSNGGAVQFIEDGRRQNLGNSKVFGIDFNVAYTFELGDWKLQAGADGTYFTRYNTQVVSGSPELEVAGTINFPQKFRMRADIGAAYEGFRGRITLNHLSGYQNNSVTPVQHVSAYDTVDLYLGQDITEKFTITAEVRNVFNRRPPFVDINYGYDPQSANPIPRLLMITAGVKF